MIGAYMGAVDRDSAADRGCTGGAMARAAQVGPPGEIRGGFSFSRRGPARRHRLRPRCYVNVEPASPNSPRERSRMSTTWANGPGASGPPGLWAVRYRMTR